MAQVNLYVPDPLYAEMLHSGTDLNWSGIFRESMLEALSKRKGCEHNNVRCQCCGVAVTRYTGKPSERDEPAAPSPQGDTRSASTGVSEPGFSADQADSAA